MIDEHSNRGWKILPLTRTKKETGERYQREADVEKQLQWLGTLSPRARQAALLADTPAGDPSRLREETLVVALRTYARCGDDALAWSLAELLLSRVSGHIARQLSKWRMPPEDADDVTRDLFSVLFDALFSRDESAQFWEVRFWVCLDRRLWNLCEKRQAQLDARQPESAETVESGDELLLRIADLGPSPESLTEQRVAMESLSETERLAVYLKYIEGLPEESEDPTRVSVAKLLGVTGRSVRNYLRRAEKKLREWNDGQRQ